MSQKNRRRHLRTKATNLVAHLRVGDRAVLAPVEDISLGGVFLRTTESIAHGTMLAFDVARPGLKRPLRLMGIVVDTRVGRGVGLRFNSLDPETGERLGELLRDLGGIMGASLADPPDPPRPAPVPVPAQARPAAPAPMPTPAHAQPSPFAQAASTGTFASPDNEASRMMVQLRGAIMEIGNLQQQLVQRDRELADLRAAAATFAEEQRKREATESLLGKLEMEKMRLQEQLAAQQGRSRGDLEQVKREAEAVIAAMGRLVDSLKRIG
jgi:hypothetical protein